MKVVLPIAALLAILTAAAGAAVTRAPEPTAPVDMEVATGAELYPVFDPFQGMGVAGLQHGTDGPGPETVPAPFEVDPFVRYGVAAPPARRVRGVTGAWDWQSFAEVRAQYADPSAGALTDATPNARTALVATDAWWSTAPLDAK